MPLPFSYEDRFPDFAPATGYAVTNEEPILLHQMLKPFRNGLGIASGGEVAFFALLPRVKDQLILVDHSYSSLKMFALKALLLTLLGPAQTRKLLIGVDQAPILEAFRKVESDLPAKLRDATGTNIKYALTSLRSEWYYASLSTLKQAVANLYKVKLVHGDLTDAKDHAPFDLLYLSNALEHQCRPHLAAKVKSSYANPDISSLTSLLRPGAQILWTSAQGPYYNANKEAAELWKVKSSIKGYRTQWLYNLSCLRRAPQPQGVSNP